MTGDGARSMEYVAIPSLDVSGRRRTRDRWLPLLHAVAGSLAGLLVGLLDGQFAASRAGLSQLDGDAHLATIFLSVWLNMPLGALLGMGVGFGLVLAHRVLDPGRFRRVALGWAGLAGFVFVSLVVIKLVGERIKAQPIEWDAVEWSLGLLGLIGTMTYLGAAWLLGGGERRYVGPIAAALTATFVFVLVGWAQVGSARADGMERVGTETTVSAAVLAGLRSVSDRDGDGFPARLCETDCDCDDSNPEIHPGAYDDPSTEADEDCDGRSRGEEDVDIYEELLATSRTPAPPAPEISAHLPDGRDVPGDAPPDLLPLAREGDVGPVPTGEEPDEVSENAAQPKDLLSEMKLSRPGPPNIVLVVIDTVRADHMSLFGYERNTTPELEAFGARSVVFEQARAAGSQTRFSVPPLMVGKYFTEIRRSTGEWPKVMEEETLVTERLKAAGYHTAAFHSLHYFKSFYGWAQGFDHYDTSCTEARAPSRFNPTSDYVTDQVLAYADSGKLDSTPYFLWVYYSDPHSPYIRHRGVPRFGDRFVDIYDGELAFTDQHVGRMLAGLEQRGQLRDTVVLITSDHGEGLDPETDHGHRYHGATLYDEIVRVPLIVHGPGLEPRRVKTPVSLMDVAPTFVALSGQPASPDLRGVSLVPYLLGADPPHPPVFFEKHKATAMPQKGMVIWPYKVIMVMPYNRTRIYNLAEDPRELVDLYGEMDPTERDRLSGILQHWYEVKLQPVRPTPRELK